MNGPVIGSLCTGYAGLEMAVQAVFGGTVAWHAENDPHASKVLKTRYPWIPNLGDITATNWPNVRPVDILAAGFPCTDISNAGKRKGIKGERSRIWKNVAEAVRVLRPRLVVLENVAAIRSRGLDVVAADLAAIGYDARWTCLRAGDSEVGAPHQRYRWICAAYPAAAHPDDLRRLWRPGDLAEANGRHESAHRGDQAAGAGGMNLLPTPAARDWKSGASNLLGRNSRPLNEFTVNMLASIRTPPTQWIASDGTDYGPAIQRWEPIVGRPAPCPTEPGTRGNRRLSPLFTEWMMGLPHGLVTGVDIARPKQLQVLGNGVVPQQVAHALRILIPTLAEEKVA